MAQYIRIYHDDETKLKKEYYEVNGIREGVYKLYRNNGKLWHECNFVNGILNGECKLYYENGNIWMIKTYINGILNGESKEYYENGQIYEKCYYVNGEFDEYQAYELYNDNGEIIEKRENYRI
jgi:uncharacterized protein